MSKICKKCVHFHDDESLCTFTPSATIAKALGLSDQYEIRSAETHPEWSCSLWEQKA